MDVGTTKIACFVAHLDDDGVLHVQGVGHHRSRGMRNGQVADMIALEESMRSAVDAAEQMANCRIDGLLLSISGASLGSQNVNTEVSVANHAIRDTDVRRILDQGIHLHTVDGTEREILHCLPTGYTIDDGDGIVDPRGMFGERLGVSIHIVSVAAGALRNLSSVVERCHLNIEKVVAAPYASALACTVDDEKDMGVTVLDMGGGTTSLSVFVEGHPVHAVSIPVGGNHVTNDIAKGLSTPVHQAERLKTMWGSVFLSPADSRELLKVPQVGEDENIEAQEIPRSELVHIIRPRLEETFELARACLSHAGMLHAAGRRVVLTGGASQLQGVREMAEHILDKQVRLGRPRRIKGLPESVGGPAFACCAGLLRYAIQDHVIQPGRPTGTEDTPPSPSAKSGKLARLGTWFKENF